MPLLGASAEAGAGAEVARAGQTILRKTLSNTVLTDYLAQVKDDPRRFEPLSTPEIKQVIDRLLADRLSKLEGDERDRLDLESLKSMLYRLADNSGNVRKLGKTVDEVIALLLVRAVLDELAPVAEQGPREERAS